MHAFAHAMRLRHQATVGLPEWHHQVLEFAIERAKLMKRLDEPRLSPDRHGLRGDLHEHLLDHARRDTIANDLHEAGHRVSELVEMRGHDR
eukprot:6874955-Prymnesium_polylepis.1